ncbi:hypothetical protein C7M56_01865 [Clostridium botulinum]|uniref:Phage protein n=1 Tax=Clostridium botulinum TaxID=1491 RepID=A0ABC8CR30_CLOBO|nr:hypothetical protein [Clostridium botulinum]AVQ37488.1 hypothetical protein C7M56_01865 [Clostridium botulinum]
MKYKGRIVKVDKHQNRAIYLKQEVDGFDQHKYVNYAGGNGTYVIGGEYFGTSLNVKVFVFDLKKSVTFDVYKQILLFKGKKRISNKLLKEIESHSGKKVDVYTSDNVNFSFDIGQII